MPADIPPAGRELSKPGPESIAFAGNRTRCRVVARAIQLGGWYFYPSQRGSCGSPCPPRMLCSAMLCWRWVAVPCHAMLCHALLALGCCALHCHAMRCWRCFALLCVAVLCAAGVHASFHRPIVPVKHFGAVGRHSPTPHASPAMASRLARLSALIHAGLCVMRIMAAHGQYIGR